MLSRDLVLEDPIHRLQLASAMDGGHGAATGIAARRLPGAEMLLPPHLIGAFRSPLFRRESLALIRRHLETRVLFHPDGPPLVVLSVPTCLALAAFVASPPKAVAAQLKIAARAACATNGWAGFWDQWVIGRAGAATGEPFPPEMQGLPLVVLGQAALDPDHGTTDARCTAEWARKAPVWALSLLGGQP